MQFAKAVLLQKLYAIWFTVVEREFEDCVINSLLWNQYINYLPENLVQFSGIFGINK